MNSFTFLIFRCVLVMAAIVCLVVFKITLEETMMNLLVPRANDTTVPAGKAASRKYNVLFVMADDLRAQLEPYEGPDYLFTQPEVRTPNFRRLAAESLLLKNAFVQFTVCGPSRTSMLTSRRPDTTRTFNNGAYWRTHSGNFTTLPQYFKHNGYTSIGIGKIFHFGEASNYSDPPSWSAPFVQVTNIDKKYIKNGTNPRWAVAAEDNMKYLMPADIITTTYAKRHLGQFALSGEPFFLAVGFYKPHASQVCPKEFFDMYTIDNRTRHLTWDEEKQVGIADHTLKEYRLAYMACISFIDSLLGDLLDTLDQLGLRDSTIVSFVSDHGYHFGEHGCIGKSRTFDMTSRVPMMVRIPGLTELGVTSDSLVEAVDLFPTLIEAAGLDPVSPCPRNSSKVDLCVEGRSFLSLIENPDAQLSGEAYTQSGRSEQFKHYSLRTLRYRLTQLATRESADQPYQFDNRRVELFDHMIDRREYKNVAFDPGYTDVLSQLQEKLHLFVNGPYEP